MGTESAAYETALLTRARIFIASIAVGCALLAVSARASADLAPPGPAPASPAPVATASASASPAASPTPAPERFSLHAQTTDTQFYSGNFPAAYSGAYSLANTPQSKKTIDATLFLGARIGPATEFYIDPELDQGYGLGNPVPPGQTGYNGTLGVAGFVSAEAYKVGSDSSYGRVQRIFVRHTFDFSGDPLSVAPAIDQLGGSVLTNHLTVTAGKFSVVDVFDNNVYAHDPKNDFLNWSIVDMGSFDYAADAWGYTYGASAELNGANQTIRAAVFQLSYQPNQIQIEHTPFLQYMPVIEYERRTSFFGGHPGSYKALVYGDDAFLGSYADAVALGAQTGTTPSTALVRHRVFKFGGGINLAQEVAAHVGVFVRASAMNGTYEADEFSDIDRSLSGGVSVDGGLYHRANDTFGLAGVANALASPAQAYFAAGGLGILVGDGAQSYAGEHILETYYTVGLAKGVGITADFQRIANPAYNVARGPLSVFGVRYHAQI